MYVVLVNVKNFLCSEFFDKIKGPPEESTFVADVLLVDVVECVDVVLYDQRHHRSVGVPVFHHPLVDNDSHTAYFVQFIVHLTKVIYGLCLESF